MSQKRAITVAYGDGIGPEIMDATLHILQEAGAQLEIETIDVGESVYKSGYTSGIEPSAWDSLRRTKVFLKAPITTPQGGGYKSLNVTIRKTLGLYANIRPSVSYHPFIDTKHPNMDLVIIRENEEDVYGGIEHQQTDEVTQCLKLISRPGTERVIRYAFEYALRNERKLVSCFTKDNIMKITDGMFHKIFDEIAADYPELKSEHWIIDIGTAKLASRPELFDVVVVPNLYGDIISDIAAELVGSVGLAGSANIGDQVAMFEAVHGSAPDIAGKGIANPSGLLMGAIKMLVHIGQADVAERIHNAWLKTIEDGIHTPDIYSRDARQEKVGTKEFTTAIVERLGTQPERLRAVHYHVGHDAPHHPPKPPAKKELVGVDVFLHWKDGSPNDLGKKLEELSGDDLKILMITNRGTKVWPHGLPETFCTDHWRCRFVSPQGEGTPVTHYQIIDLLKRVADAGLDFIKTEHLCHFDGKPAYSLGQGQ